MAITSNYVALRFQMLSCDFGLVSKCNSDLPEVWTLFFLLLLIFYVICIPSFFYSHFLVIFLSPCTVQLNIFFFFLIRVKIVILAAGNIYFIHSRETPPIISNNHEIWLGMLKIWLVARKKGWPGLESQVRSCTKTTRRPRNPWMKISNFFLSFFFFF